jgi:uncharacterized protein
MEAQKMISVEEARRFYIDDDPVHGFEHVLRVWRLARQIGLAEGANMAVLEAAALLHDVARADEESSGACHAQAGAARARDILRGQSPEQVEAVAGAICTHRFRDNAPPQTLEARILYDADKLDAIGAIGVARAYAMSGKHNKPLWAEVSAQYAERQRTQGRGDATSEGHTAVHEFVFKLSRLRDTLFTDTAKRIAAERHRFMSEFFARLNAEVKGEL